MNIDDRLEQLDTWEWSGVLVALAVAIIGIGITALGAGIGSRALVQAGAAVTLVVGVFTLAYALVRLELSDLERAKRLRSRRADRRRAA